MKRVTFTVPKSGLFSPLTVNSLTNSVQTGNSAQAVQTVPSHVAAQQSELDREIEKALGSLNLDTFTHITPQGIQHEPVQYNPSKVVAQVVPPSPVPDTTVTTAGKGQHDDLMPESHESPQSVAHHTPEPTVYPAPQPQSQASSAPLGLPAPQENVDEYEVYYRQHNLVGAIFRGDLAELRAMLNNGTSPNQFDDARTYSALHFAAHRNLYLFAEALLDAGADPNIVGHDLQTPLHCAQTLAVGALLHRRGAKLSLRNSLGQEPIHTLSDRGCTSLIDYLVVHGVSINATDAHGKTALHWAAWGGRVHTLEWLFRNGGDMWIRDHDQAYPLHWASVKGHFEVVRTIKRLLTPHKFYQQVTTTMSENRLPEYLAEYHLNKHNIRILNTLREKAYRRKYAVETEGRIFEPTAEEHVVLSLPDQVPPAESEFYMKDIGMQREEGRLRYLAVLREYGASHRQASKAKRCCGLSGRISDFWAENLRGAPVVATGLWIAFTWLGVWSTDRQCPDNQVVTWFAHLAFNAMILGAIYFWYTTVWAEPGALRPDALPIPGQPEYSEVHGEYLRLLKLGTLEDSQACSTCRIIKPLRSKHCSICGHCVLKFDHHCPFLDVDIGAGNYLNFIFFLLCAAIGGITASYIILHALTATGTIRNGIESRTCLGSYSGWGFWPMLVPFSHLAGFIATGLLLAQHYPLIKDNFTTNERVNINKYTHFWSSGYIVNPFDMGNLLNIATFFGCVIEPIIMTVAEAKHRAELNLKRWRGRKIETCHGHSHGSADADIAIVHDVHAEAI